MLHGFESVESTTESEHSDLKIAAFLTKPKSECAVLQGGYFSMLFSPPWWQHHSRLWGVESRRSLDRKLGIHVQGLSM